MPQWCELLAENLVLRSHVEALAAQLERLVARVATLERLSLAAASSSRTRFEPAAAARARPMTLLDLAPDVLNKVAACLGRDDELAASLACRKLRDALRGVRSREQRLLKTRVGSLLGSLGKLRWGVTCVGVPLNAELLAPVAGRGDLRMLSELRTCGCTWPDRPEAGI